MSKISHCYLSQTYEHHAFIVSEAPDHGMQVFDLKQLRYLSRNRIRDGIKTLKETAHYGEFGKAHNIVANTDTGYMYAVGTRTCNSGLHVVNAQNPRNPTFAGCFSLDGYTHDAQCVVYNGPDTRYRSDEICFCFNEDTMTIVNVTDKSNMQMISRVTYTNVHYAHQGWLTEDQAYIVMNDELDELRGRERFTRSVILNVRDLNNSEEVMSFHFNTRTIDHNLYIK